MSDLKNFNAIIRRTETQAYLSSVLAEKKDGFVTNICALVSNDKLLQQCEPLSIMYAAMTATALDLPLDKNLGQAYVIPYKDKGKPVAQFQIGWKGLVTLAQRSGVIRYLNAVIVHEGELIENNLLTGVVRIEPKPNREELPIIGYVAYVKLLNGFEKAIYMSIQEVEKHATRYSQGYKAKKGYTTWETNFDAMALKTVVKRLINQWVPKDTHMNTAIMADQSVQTNFGQYRYTDNEGARGQLNELAERVVSESNQVYAEIEEDVSDERDTDTDA